MLMKIIPANMLMQWSGSLKKWNIDSVVSRGVWERFKWYGDPKNVLPNVFATFLNAFFM